MFGISLPELIVIFVIVLLFIGPDKLPDVANKIGKFVGALKKNSDAIRREFYNSVYVPTKEIQSDVKRELVTIKSAAVTPPTTEQNSSTQVKKDESPTTTKNS